MVIARLFGRKFTTFKTIKNLLAYKPLNGYLLHTIKITMTDRLLKVSKVRSLNFNFHQSLCLCKVLQ